MGFQGTADYTVADKNTDEVIRGLLERPRAIGIRNITADTFRHPEHDPGVVRKGSDFLRSFVSAYHHALVLFDRVGSGCDLSTREKIEQEVESNLENTGWRGRAAAVAIDPELEAWVWSNSPHVDEALGWQGRHPNLRAWLRNQGLLADGATKPTNPKEAMEKALRHVRRPRSSAIYRELADRVGLPGCKDQAFLKLLNTLKTWFSE